VAFNGAVPILNKDMTLCISLSARPSNNGTRFHNHLYEQLGLNWIYKAFAPTDLAQAIAGVRGLGIRGCAVSMPYKEDVIALVDAMDPSAKAIDSVNTIVNDGGRLTAYNTDYTAIEQLLKRNAVPVHYSVFLKGSGGMAKATAAALRDAGFADVTVIARSEASGRALADLYGFKWRAELPETDSDSGAATSSDAGTADMIINVTPIGMAGSMADSPDADSLSFPQAAVDAAKVVFDVVALPAETPLIKAARAADKAVITGAEVATIQALEQFVLYTGIRPTDEQVRAAEEFMRAQ
jgi:shikimate dehydrogenase